MAIGMSREEVRQRLIAGIRSGYFGARNVASLSRTLGYQMSPGPQADKQWAATNSIVKELADAVAEVIEENNRRWEKALEERLSGR